MGLFFCTCIESHQLFWCSLQDSHSLCVSVLTCEGCASCRATADCCFPSTVPCACWHSPSPCPWPSACSPRCLRYSALRGSQKAQGAAAEMLTLHVLQLARTARLFSLTFKAKMESKKKNLNSCFFSLVFWQIEVSRLEPEIAMATKCKVVTYNKGLWRMAQHEQEEDGEQGWKKFCPENNCHQEAMVGLMGTMCCCVFTVQNGIPVLTH